MIRSQQRLADSIRTLPLNQSEVECRRHTGPLPRFNGEPTRWFRFISTYRDIAARCVFSAVENLERLSAALEEPARGRVVHLLDRPH